jgi:hypothetical protein
VGYSATIESKQAFYLTRGKYVPMSSMSGSVSLQRFDVIHDAQRHYHMPDVQGDAAYQAQADKLPAYRLYGSSRDLVVSAPRGYDVGILVELSVMIGLFVIQFLLMEYEVASPGTLPNSWKG